MKPVNAQQVVSKYRRGHTATSEEKRVATYRRTVRNRNREPKGRFLSTFGKFATLTLACDAAGIDVATFYRWRDDDEDFAQAVQAAELRVVERLEERALRRAMGQSDSLLWRMLQARKPHVYAPARQVEVAAHLSVTNLTPEAIRNLSNEELEMARRIVRKLRGEYGGRPPGVIDVEPSSGGKQVDS